MKKSKTRGKWLWAILSVSAVLLILLIVFFNRSVMLLERHTEVVEEYGEITGKVLMMQGNGGNVSGDYAAVFKTDEIVDGVVLDEAVYADLEYRSLRENWYLDPYSVSMAESGGHPSHQLLVAVLSGRILHETATFRAFGGIHFTTERYYIDSPRVSAYELFVAWGTDEYQVMNYDMTECRVFKDDKEFEAALGSREVADIVH